MHAFGQGFVGAPVQLGILDSYGRLHAKVGEQFQIIVVELRMVKPVDDLQSANWTPAADQGYAQN